MGDLAIQGEEHGATEVVHAEHSVAEIVAQIGKIDALISSVMREGEHYGKIPGTDKPTLLQPGAQKLNLMFRLVPKFTTSTTELEGGHREVRSTCDLYHAGTGRHMGQGMGSCSTMESKYRWRPAWEDTGGPIPQDSKERKDEYRKQGYGMKKDDAGRWLWVHYLPERAENPDIADCYNTVLKISNKRSLIAATLNATGASDRFTQDVEDMQHDGNGHGESGKPRNVTPTQQPAPQSPQQPAQQGEGRTGYGRPFASKYLGECPECGHTVNVGDQIRYHYDPNFGPEGRRAEHAQCPVSDPQVDAAAEAGFNRMIAKETRSMMRDIVAD